MLIAACLSLIILILYKTRTSMCCRPSTTSSFSQMESALRNIFSASPYCLYRLRNLAYASRHMPKRAFNSIVWYSVGVVVVVVFSSVVVVVVVEELLLESLIISSVVARHHWNPCLASETLSRDINIKSISGCVIDSYGLRLILRAV